VQSALRVKLVLHAAGGSAKTTASHSSSWPPNRAEARTPYRPARLRAAGSPGAHTPPKLLSGREASDGAQASPARRPAPASLIVTATYPP
jgi:hypothetical protein